MLDSEQLQKSVQLSVSKFVQEYEEIIPSKDMKKIKDAFKYRI